MIRNVVASVLAEVGPMPLAVGGGGGKPTHEGANGIFQSADAAVAAARSAFERFRHASMATRQTAIDVIRTICDTDREELGRMEFEETGVGRLEHKVEKLAALTRAPGTEYLQSRCFSGDHGLTVIARAPFGVIGAITPVTPPTSRGWHARRGDRRDSPVPAQAARRGCAAVDPGASNTCAGARGHCCL